MTVQTSINQYNSRFLFSSLSIELLLLVSSHTNPRNSSRTLAPAAEMANHRPLAGLPDHVKLARDYALEGLYDTSIIFFDGAIAQIK
jgi:hypothetical protein